MIHQSKTISRQTASVIFGELLTELICLKNLAAKTNFIATTKC